MYGKNYSLQIDNQLLSSRQNHIYVNHYYGNFIDKIVKSKKGLTPEKYLAKQRQSLKEYPDVKASGGTIPKLELE